jgi:nitrogenase molybdenum-iron protein beta chain
MTENTQTPAPQTPDTTNPGKILDHVDLFQTEEYKDLFEYKRQFEGAHSKEKVAEVAEWTKAGNIGKRTLPAKP